MSFRPVSRESLEGLRRLREDAIARGDDCLGTLLAGIELYVVLGREFELLESMRHFAHEMEECVANTPTAAELERLYFLDPPPTDRPA
jgi:hypothetical protein